MAEFSDASFLSSFVGTHRIQRIPKGEARRHTSTITVAVLGALNGKRGDESPGGVTGVFDLEEFPQNQELREEDLEERFARGSGPGGQHRNKTDSCVVLTHLPTGIEVRIDGRSQWQNRQEARAEMVRRLACSASDSFQLKLNAERVDQIGTSERASKAFTYNDQRDEVVDHSTGQKWRMSAFMKGRF